jgi:Icc protein
MSVVRVLQLSDTHIVATDDEPDSLATAVHQLSGRTTSETLEGVLTRLSDSGFAPDVLVHTGDVVDTADPAGYEAAARIMAAVVAPALVVPGNHDDPVMLAAVFGDKRTVAVQGWSIIGLDSRVEGIGSGAIGEKGLTWLDDQLASTDAHVLIGLHHPPLSACGDPYCALEDSYDLLAVLDRHPHVRGVVSGHLHLADQMERRGVQYLLSPSTCIQLRHRHPLAENNRAATPVGARLIDLHEDGRITSEIVWTP